jgi:PAS domain S-box-containing protein
VKSERRADFLVKLGERLHDLTVPDDITAAATQLLGSYLGTARALYAEVTDANGTFLIRQDWTRDSLTSVAGEARTLDEFGPEIVSALRSGEAVVVDDIALDPRTARRAAAYETIGACAFLCIPFLRSSKLMAIWSLHQTAPYHWTSSDIQLAYDAAERTWSAAETAQTQAELHAERDRSQYVFDTMTEGFAMLDRDWTVLYMNPAGLRLGQRRQQQVIGCSHWEVWPETVGTEVEHLYRRVMQTRSPESVEYHQSFPDGHAAWFDVRAYPALEDGLAIFFRDITKRRGAEEKLKDADRRKDEFLAMLAHELRNPLAPIGAAAELLQMVKLDEARVRQTSQIIGRQVEHMTGLVNDLLDVSRVTRGKVELDIAPLDINHILTDAVEQVSPLVGARKHRLMLDLSPNVVLVAGDKKRLVQVVANLLTNAAKYTHEGGNILLKTTVREDRVHVEVTDNGIGMDSELVEHAFDLFAQAERTSDRSSGGLGLGLALVKSLVELHGGTVTCASEGLGQGSTFTVCLPRLLEQQNHVDRLHGDEPLRSGRQSLRVLLVDDNVDAAVMLKMLLEAAGYEVLVEHGAHRALERAKADKPEVCLIDIGLPELDGNQLAQRLRSLPEMASAVLIAVTGYGQETDRKNALAAGFDHHLVKPVDIKRLAAILNEINIS